MLDDLEMRIYKTDLFNTNLAKNKMKNCILDKQGFGSYNANGYCDFTSAIELSNSSFIDEKLNKIVRNREYEINRINNGVSYLVFEIEDKIKNKEKELSLNSMW